MAKPLSNYCKAVVDCPHSTADDEGTGFPLIRTPNIGRGWFLLNDVQRVSKAIFDRRNKRAVPESGDLIFAREAPAGNVAIIREGEHLCLGQRTVLIKPDPSLINPLFLMYYLLSPYQQFRILSKANGSTVSHVNMEDIRDFKMENLPTMERQNEIANVLGNFDKAILANRGQINLLSEITRSIYSEWFVRYRFPGFEKEVFKDNKPSSWKTIKLVDYIEFQKGFEPGAEAYSDDSSLTPFIRVGDIGADYPSTFINGSDFSDIDFLKESDVVISFDASVGKMGFGLSGAFSSGVCRLRGKDPSLFGGAMLLNLFEDERTQFFISMYANGATIGHAGKSIKKLTMLFDEKTVRKYSALMDPLFEKMLALQAKNRLLEAQREELIARLIDSSFFKEAIS